MKKDLRNTQHEATESKRPENDGESFGAWLRRQRSGRGIELREIAESSKISLQYLKAFEADRFDLLPGEVFAKGFLRQYAGYVGLDPEEVVNFYLTASQSEEDEDSLEPRPQRMSKGSSSRFVLLSLLLIALLVAVVWWLSRAQEGGAAGGQSSALPGGSPSASSTRPSTPPAAASEPSGAGASQAPTAAGGSAEPTVPVAATAGPSASETAIVGDLAPPADDVEASSTLRIAVEFSDSCWVEAKVDGERRVSITKVQGESLLLEAEEEVDFVFGNVHAVRLEVNGEAFPLTPRRGTSRLGVRIDRQVLESMAAESSLAPGDGGT